MKLRTRISLTYVALIAGGVVALSVLSNWQIRKFLDDRETARLIGHTRLLADLFVSGALHLDTALTEQEDLAAIAHTLGARLTLIGRDGRVLYDSEVPRDSLGTLENHATRPEVLLAISQGSGTDIRHSHSVGEDFLYASTQIKIPATPLLDGGFVRIALPLNEITQLNGQIQKIIGLFAALAVLATILVSVQVSNRVTRPILRIAETAEAIKGGALDRRVNVSSKDEIGALATAINGMADTLSKDIARMRTLERVRSEFLANVSHELRTPIFSVQGFLETLLDGAVDDPAVNRDFLEKAHRHAARLNALLNDLIEISRIESGEMKMSFRFFPVGEFVRHVAEEMRAAAEKKGLRFIVSVETADDMQVYGDRERLKQVLVNLIDNAIKYTDPGRTVQCRVRTDDSGCRIEVEDTGPGIPAEHLDRIFERFYRVDRDRSREVGGTGLGLAIVKHIVEAHGGKIDVVSEVGKGSTFSFTVKR